MKNRLKYMRNAFKRETRRFFTFAVIILFTLFVIPAFVSNNNSQKTEVGISTDSLHFSYSVITGIGIDSLFNRRDNSDIIKVGNKYYLWYTKMVSPNNSGYWGTIWYATSEDEGHTWKEKGMALDVSKKGEFDSHSVFTPNILAYKGKYYLYYTAVKPTLTNSENKFENNSVNDFTAIGLASSNSPDGPFKRVSNKPVLTISSDSSAFDSYRIDDASLMVRENKIWLYYKGRSIIHGKMGPAFTKMGLAFSKKPEGPFEKYEKPILDRSHEVLVWNQDNGVASLASLSSSYQFASDGINFRPILENLKQIPMAPGLYRPQLEDGNKATKIPGWGIAMVQKKGKTYLVRYEMKK